MQKELPRPSAVIFSTTDCGHCPGVITALAEQISHRKMAIPLVVVVMDGEGQDDLLHEPHYQNASRLFIFHGQTAALQYGINPNWRGITPYVALLPRVGETKLVLGKPSDPEIKRWLAIDERSGQWEALVRRYTPLAIQHFKEHPMQTKQWKVSLMSKSMLMSILRCFNVAAICALAVWHGYGFFLHQAIEPKPQMEFKLQVPNQKTNQA
jgi:hypothetical protein